MTRWEPMDSAAAEAKVRRAATRDDLRERLGPGPSQDEFRRDLEGFIGALHDLRHAPRDTRAFALACALEVALTPEGVPATQHLALRTVLDALALEPRDLEDLHHRRMGHPLPPPADPSLVASWPDAEDQTPPETFVVDAARIARIKALALLGLDEGATEEEIRQAFRRVSMVHHPDHFQTLGREASRDATRTFLRIKEAHDYLLGPPR
ncbi:MAG TPA: J domain-containing protein [Holophagaceae bacterium]|nr:J domain-containing protein [Holophagaceae bacterium]